MKTRLLSLFLAAVAVVFTFSACGGGGGVDTEPGVINTYDFASGRKYFFIYASPSNVTIRTTLGGNNELEGVEEAPPEGDGKHLRAYASVNNQDEQEVAVFYRYEGDHTAIMNITNMNGGEFVGADDTPDFIEALAGTTAGSDDAERVIEIRQLRFNFNTMWVQYTVRTRTEDGGDSYEERDEQRQFAVIRQQG